MAKWARELKAAGLAPALNIIEAVNTDTRRGRELFWIEQYVKDGHDLLNCDGVERKYGMAPRWRQ